MDNNTGNKRLAINTIILYAKLIITIVISFLASRLVLDALGASDYGLYNVVGGIVTMLNTLGAGMVATSYRYMAVEIGKGPEGNPNKVYNTILIIHIALALFLILICETVGVYYVNNYLNVAEGKIEDALFVLHLSVLATVFSVISVPSYGLTIARERFLFTSIIDVLSAFLKIGLIILLFYMDGNKLRYYAIFLAIVHVIAPIAYTIYCWIKDKDIVKWSINRSWSDYKGVLAFAWWILLGAVACLATVQGASMVINYFFGTVLNAAYGLASQLYAATNQFTSTLRQAAIPQIMKSYSSGDEGRSLNLVYTISRFSFLFILIPAVPLIICVKGALQLWLGTPPEYTDLFIIFLLINGMVENLGSGFNASIQASGNIRKNQIGYSVINLSLIPIIFILYKMGLPPYINAIVMIFLTFCTLIFQCFIMKGLTSFSFQTYFKVTVLPALKTVALAFIPSYIITMFFGTNTWAIVVNLAIVLIWTVFSIFVTGTKKSEKEAVLGYITKMSGKFVKYKD